MSERYDNYLKSTHWKTYRQTELERAGFKCEDCGARECLQVHHLTYKYLKKEHLNPGCCRVLCRNCHTATHFNMSWSEIEQIVAGWFPHGWK